MARFLVKHPLASSPREFNKLIQNLENHFSEWSFTERGAFRTRKGSVHYHVKSKKKGESGTLEITYDPQLEGKVELKLNPNREGNWGESAFKQLLEYLAKD